MKPARPRTIPCIGADQHSITPVDASAWQRWAVMGPEGLHGLQVAARRPAAQKRTMHSVEMISVDWCTDRPTAGRGARWSIAVRDIG